MYTTVDISKYMEGSAKGSNWRPIKDWLTSNVGPMRTVDGPKAIGHGWTVSRADKTLDGTTQTIFLVEFEDEALALMFKLIWS